MNPRILTFLSTIFLSATISFAGSPMDGWYTQGDFEPTSRIKVILTNPLGIDQKDCPVTILRGDLPSQNIPQRFITVVDPLLPSLPEPTAEEMARVGGYILRKETNGHFIDHQMDDIDKDGIWDELFFMIDMKAFEVKTLYLYIGGNFRGLTAHSTHANIGYYGKHVVPFWESEYIGWKLWFETDCDLHGKKEPMLTSYPEYQQNLAGYFVPIQFGSDIMTVATTFGAGGICLFEYSAYPDSISRPRFSPYADQGHYLDTRYALDVVYNGPLRSAISVHTMNWNSGAGNYELRQLYTSYARKAYSTCKVTFIDFFPKNPETKCGCGIRQIMNEYESVQNDGYIVSMGKDIRLRDPHENIGEEGLLADFEGIAIAVKSMYTPEYVKIKGFEGNHAFKIQSPKHNSYEYMLLAGWNRGVINNDEEEFKNYVITETQKYNHPIQFSIRQMEEKEK